MSDVRYTQESYLASDCIRVNDVRGVFLRETNLGEEDFWEKTVCEVGECDWVR